MSLLCLKNCRESAMLLDMPTDQLLKKRVFKENEKNKPTDDNDKPDLNQETSYSLVDAKSSKNKPLMIGNQDTSSVVRTPKNKDKAMTTSWGRLERTQDGKSAFQKKKDQEGHNKKPKKDIKSDYKTSEIEMDGKKEKDKKSGWLSKLEKSMLKFLKSDDSKKEEREPEKSQANASGYEAGESGSESNFSIITNWSTPYDDRRSGQPYRSQTGRHASDSLSLYSFDSGIADYRGSSFERSIIYTNGNRDSGRSDHWSGPSMENISRNDHDGIKRKHTRDNDIDFRDGCITPTNVWVERPMSLRETGSLPKPRAFDDRNQRKYASTGNLTDYSSSADSRMFDSSIDSMHGSSGRYRSSEIIIRRPTSYSGTDSSAISPRRIDGGKVTNKFNRHSMINTSRNYMEPDTSFSRKKEDSMSGSKFSKNASKITLDLDFDYKVETSRLYVILKSMHGLTSKDTATGKTNIRVHLVVMPERFQRAYTRRKSEGWTVRFMEKFRFSEINSLNSISFKIVLNDGSTNERIIGSSTVHMKGLVLSNTKQSLTIEINRLNYME